MIAVVTDSTSQMPSDLIERLRVEIVPITIVIDGTSYLEGIDIDADRFFELVRPSDIGKVTSSQPSPGQFVETYRNLIEGGATEIVSIHVAEAYSGTLNSARLAAGMVDVPVHLVDSQSVAFGVTACVWAAAEARDAGATAVEMVAAAERVAPHIGHVTMLGSPGFIEAGGRVDLGDLPEGFPVMVAVDGDVQVTGSGRTREELAELLAQPFADRAGPIRTAVSHSDEMTLAFADRLAADLEAMPHVVDVTRFRIGPSVAVQAGPGAAGGSFWPAL